MIVLRLPPAPAGLGGEAGGRRRRRRSSCRARRRWAPRDHPRGGVGSASAIGRGRHEDTGAVRPRGDQGGVTWSAPPPDGRSPGRRRLRTGCLRTPSPAARQRARRQGLLGSRCDRVFGQVAVERRLLTPFDRAAPRDEQVKDDPAGRYGGGRYTMVNLPTPVTKTALFTRSLPVASR